MDPTFESWIAALERRHLADLTFPEVRRALQALSSLYVERRERLAGGSALDGAGKRAAFALYYAPSHYLTVRDVVRELDLAVPAPGRILDLGCGTGAAGAAWAREAGGTPEVEGVDLSGWALEEAAWTWQALGIRGRARRADAAALPTTAEAVVAGWTVNELSTRSRDRLLARLLGRPPRRLLVLEPIAVRTVPWWEGWAEAIRRAGGREDLWRFPAGLPEISERLARAAGLDPGERTARSLALGALS